MDKGYAILVNKYTYLPENYAPDDIVEMSNWYAYPNNSIRQEVYDAFKEMGGNLSFALCLLDDNNNGFILNTMHGRESSYTYIKEIENGTAYSTLGEEEKQALQKAISSDED